MWWYSPLTPALGKQRQVNLCELEARLIYIVSPRTARPYIKKIKNTVAVQEDRALSVLPVGCHKCKVFKSFFLILWLEKLKVKTQLFQGCISLPQMLEMLDVLLGSPKKSPSEYFLSHRSRNQGVCVHQAQSSKHRGLPLVSVPLSYPGPVWLWFRICS